MSFLCKKKAFPTLCPNLQHYVKEITNFIKLYYTTYYTMKNLKPPNSQKNKKKKIAFVNFIFIENSTLKILFGDDNEKNKIIIYFMLKNNIS